MSNNSNKPILLSAVIRCICHQSDPRLFSNHVRKPLPEMNCSRSKTRYHKHHSLRHWIRNTCPSNKESMSLPIRTKSAKMKHFSWSLIGRLIVGHWGPPKIGIGVWKVVVASKRLAIGAAQTPYLNWFGTAMVRYLFVQIMGNSLQRNVQAIYLPHLKLLRKLLSSSSI